MIDDSGLDWCVYWLKDPFEGVPFYAGCTKRPADRLRQHCSDPGSAAYVRCRQILAAGRRPVLVVLARHALPEYALAQERALISEFTDQFTNRFVPIPGDPIEVRPRAPNNTFDRASYMRAYMKQWRKDHPRKPKPAI